MTVAALPDPKPSWPRSETCSMEEGNLEAGTAESSCVSDAADVVEPDLGSARFLLQRGLGTARLVLLSKLLTRHVGHAHALLWLKNTGSGSR